MCSLFSSPSDTFLHFLITVFVCFAVITFLIGIFVAVCYICKKRKLAGTLRVSNHNMNSASVTTTSTATTTAPVATSNQETSFTNPLEYGKAQQNAYEKDAEFSTQEAPPSYNSSATFLAVSQQPTKVYYNT